VDVRDRATDDAELLEQTELVRTTSAGATWDRRA
jgi:hypothetical protein